MPKYTQANRPVQIITPLGEDVLLLQGFSGREEVSRLFAFALQLHSENRAIDFNSIVGKNATIQIALSNGSVRSINGIISSFAQGGTSQNLTHYRAMLVPWLWLLTRTSGCRIFQNMTAPDIIQKIFQDFGFTDFKNRLQGSYAAREYCVQYRETAFAFVSRLMEEEGIFYFFDHEETKHTLVLADAPAEFKVSPHQPLASFTTIAEDRMLDEVITEWMIEQEVRPGKYTVNDFDFEKPTHDLTATIEGKDTRKYEIYDYPGDYKTRDEGDRLAGIRVQEQDAPLIIIRGAGNYSGFAPGYKFTLKNHYRRDLNKDYALLSVEHDADLGDNYETFSADDAPSSAYSNRFECVPHPTNYRPPRMTPAPVIKGSQTAIITGPAGEEIYTDAHGRVKVQFHWDREGKYDEKSSCWIRVSQNWAGKRWGAIFLPRIGQEVIVDFLEGNPDRPVITGRVYNGGSVPPYALPDEKTKSAVKSYSSKGGGGFNELRFEDKKGDEQIFIHAEKDQDVRIKNDVKTFVGNDSHLIVTNNQLEKVGGDKHLTVTGDRNEKVDGTVSLKVGMDLQEKVGMKYGLDAGMSVHIKAGMSLVIEAGTAITIKAGSNSISLTPAGIFIAGTPMVFINSGSASVPGAGCSPQPPTAPKEAAEAEPGQKAELPPPKTLPAPTKYSPAALVMRQAAEHGMPFCPI